MICQGDFSLTQDEGQQMGQQLLFKPVSSTGKTVAFTILEGAENIALTSEGQLTAIELGTAKIKATNAAAGIGAECMVTVLPKPIEVQIIDASAFVTVNVPFTFQAKVLPSGALQEVEFEVVTSGALPLPPSLTGSLRSAWLVRSLCVPRR